MSPSDSMAGIMSADKKVEALPDIGVMDCYVRAKLMRSAMDKYRNHPDGWDASGYESMKNALLNYDKEGLRCNVAMDRDASGWLREAAKENRSEDFVVAVFDRVTNSEWGREKSINVAREWLKDHLSGSMGMPDDEVIRENLKNYDS